MTVAEAANTLEVSPALVYKLCHAGKLPHHRIGTGRGVIRIAIHDLADFKRSCEVGTPEDEETPKRRGKKFATPGGLARLERILKAKPTG